LKNILIFRHAESPYGSDFPIDHDRPLTKRGCNDAKKIGIFIKQEKIIPELVISSSAKRAIFTTECAHKFGNWNSKIIIDSNIYGGNPSFLVNLVNNQDDKYSSICLVGHEPDFSSFIAECANINYIHFPTASLVKIDFETNSWKNIGFGYGKIVLHKEPKDIILEKENKW